MAAHADGVQAFDTTIHVKCWESLVDKIDKAAKEIGLSRADYTRLVLTLAAKDKTLLLSLKRRVK